MTEPPEPRPPRVAAIDWLWPALACVLGWQYIIRHFHAPVMFDSKYNYLPAARAFLEQGWAFLLTPQSFRVVPLGYLWPALWGANPDAIRAANMGLWLACVWFLWRASHLLGGRRAALLAMLLLAVSNLHQYFPSEMTEPVWLFGVFGLIHALARLLIGQDRGTGAVAQGALMLSITLLSRPVLQLMAPAALLCCLAALAVTARGDAVRANGPPVWRAVTGRVALSLGLGLIIPAALVLKNIWAFGLWGLGTGAGTGLYLGTHLLFQGTEPAFLGFDYDNTALISLAVHQTDQFMLASDRVSRQAALWTLHSMPASDVAAFFGRKLWWWLAHHPVEINRTGHWHLLRKVRLFELSTLAVAGLWAVCQWRLGRRNRSSGMPARGGPPLLGLTPSRWAFALTLLGIFVLLLAQLLPILYNARYSVALLDPWLIPPVACGLGLMSGTVRSHCVVKKKQWLMGLKAAENESILRAVILFLLVILMVLVVQYAGRKLENVAIDPERTGPLITLFQTSDATRAHVSGMSPQGERTWVMTASPAVLMIDLTWEDVARITQVHPFNALWDTELALKIPDGGRCRRADITYQDVGDKERPRGWNGLSLQLRLKADGQFHRLLTHANNEMRPRATAGSWRAVLDCPVGTVVDWRRTSFLDSRYAQELVPHLKP